MSSKLGFINETLLRKLSAKKVKHDIEWHKSMLLKNRLRDRKLINFGIVIFLLIALGVIYLWFRSKKRKISTDSIDEWELQ